ncbi:MAG: TolC family protein [Acidobacteriaceae bacterium]
MMQKTMQRLFILLVGFLWSVSPGQLALGQQPESQPSSLADAVAIALGKSPQHQMATADLALSRAKLNTAKTGYLPHFDFSETAERGNDPVYAFGTRLRQQRFTQENFALNQLNRPGPIGDFVTRLSGQWNLFNSFQTSLGVRQEKHMRAAAQQALSRSDQQVVYQTVASWYALLLAERNQTTAQEAVKTAAALVEHSQHRVQAGIAVDSDMLAAQADEAARQQDAVEAGAQVAIARSQLASTMGTSLADTFLPPVDLKEAVYSVVPLAEAEKAAYVSRPDWKQIQEQQQATATGVRAARAGFGPQVNAFGSWEKDNIHFTGDGGNNWVAGAEIRIDLFNAGKVTQLQEAKAQQMRVDAAKNAVQSQIRLEVDRAWYQHQAAVQMMQTAHSALRQTQEALRITRNRYDAGLATVTEVLRAQDALRASQTRYWQAVYNNSVSDAALELAIGTLTEQSKVVTQ